MTNVTLKIDEDLAREARILAAKRGISMSRLLADELASLVKADTAYDLARMRATERLAKGFDLGYQKPLSREALHER